MNTKCFQAVGHGNAANSSRMRGSERSIPHGLLKLSYRHASTSDNNSEHTIVKASTMHSQGKRPDDTQNRHGMGKCGKHMLPNRDHDI